MRFMMLYRPGRDDGLPPNPDVFAKLDQLTREATAVGTFISTDGLHPSAKGARVSISNGNFAVIDGPFTEAKEVIAGYAILQLSSKEEAIEHAKRFLAVMGEGQTEVRQMLDPSDFAEAAAAAHAASRPNTSTGR